MKKKGSFQYFYNLCSVFNVLSLISWSKVMKNKYMPQFSQKIIRQF